MNRRTATIVACVYFSVAVGKWVRKKTPTITVRSSDARPTDQSHRSETRMTSDEAKPCVRPETHRSARSSLPRSRVPRRTSPPTLRSSRGQPSRDSRADERRRDVVHQDRQARAVVYEEEGHDRRVVVGEVPPERLRERGHPREEHGHDGQRRGSPIHGQSRDPHVRSPRRASPAPWRSLSPRPNPPSRARTSRSSDSSSVAPSRADRPVWEHLLPRAARISSSPS